MTRKRIAFLGCKYCLPNSPERRTDAYEHDREMEAFRPAFAHLDMELVDVDWETLDPTDAAFDLFMVRTTWNYIDNPQGFIRKLRRLSEFAPVQNEPDLIEWNMSKRYLQELQSNGLPVIPSAFVETKTTTINDLRDRLGSAEIVLKPVFGGGGLRPAEN